MGLLPSEPEILNCFKKDKAFVDHDLAAMKQNEMTPSRPRVHT